MNGSSGIYQIACHANRKLYIGQSSNIVQRKSQHFGLLRRGKCHNTHLQSAYNKYGESAFAFSVLEYCSVDNLTEREAYWDRLLPSSLKFNTRLAVDSNRGFSMPTEAREKLRLAHLGRKATSETKERMRNSNHHLGGVPKAIVQLEVGSGTIVARYVSAMAAERTIGVNAANIAQVCLGKRGSAGGYVWRYELCREQ